MAMEFVPDPRFYGGPPVPFSVPPPDVAYCYPAPTAFRSFAAVAANSHRYPMIIPQMFCFPDASSYYCPSMPARCQDLDGRYRFSHQPLLPQQGFHYFVVVDLQSTTNLGRSCEHEVIDFSSVVINTATGEEALFHAFVRPDYKPWVCDATRKRMGVHLVDAEASTCLEHALQLHDLWLVELGVKNASFAVVNWGGDCLVKLEKECRFKFICRQGYLDQWIDLESAYSQLPDGRHCTLLEAVEETGLEWDGSTDCGLDSARNTASLLVTLMSQGMRFSVTRSQPQTRVGAFRMVTWSPPGPGMIKVNFDGALSQEGAGYGAIVRGEDGNIIATVFGKGHDDSVAAIEARGALCGLRLAKSLGYKNIWLEGDSTLLIDWINSVQINPPCLGIIDEIKLELKSCSWKATHILREGNQAADLLSQWGKEREGEVTSVEGFSPNLIKLADQDLCPLFFIRR